MNKPDNQPNNLANLSLEEIAESEIDTSDIPEDTDWSAG